MPKSITRKFLVKQVPDLSSKSKDTYQRYYLYNNNSTVIRIQQINDQYEIERKANESELVRHSDTIKITPDEFETLKEYASGSIQRESYHIQDNPRVVLRIYHAEYQGLIRAEVNFTDEDEANSFSPLEWFDKEITGTPLAQDEDLLKLSKESFKELIN